MTDITTTEGDPHTGTPATREDRMTAVVGLGAAIAACVALLVPVSDSRLVGGLLVATTAAGCAFLCHFDARDRAVQSGLILAVSLTTFAVLTTLMIWWHFWHPVGLLYLLALGSGATCCRRLIVGSSPA